MYIVHIIHQRNTRTLAHMGFLMYVTLIFSSTSISVTPAVVSENQERGETP